MEQGLEAVVVRHSRTPRNKEQRDYKVRESLLSESTSGICKGDEEDTTSVGTTSFPSPDLDISNKEKLLPEGDVKIEVVHKVNGNVIAKDPDSESDEESVVVIKKDTPKIPDGGWGWIVVLSSFIISMIADGVSFSFGLLYIEFLDEFEASKSTTAWIGSLFIAVPLLSGPVMSALVDRYGCKNMTILGGIISTIGFILASISNSLEMMMLTFGVIAGLGLGLVYVTAVVSIAFWFEKKRNLAVGLGACGTGVGTFVYAPLTQYFIVEYGWRGTILLLSGTLLNLCVCGCVMRDPEWWIIEQKKQKADENKLKKDDSKSKNSSSGSLMNPYAVDYEVPTRGKIMEGLIKRGVAPEKVLSEEVATIKRHQNMLNLKKMNKMRQRSNSVTNLPTYLTHSDNICMKTLDLLVKSTNIENGKDIKCPKFEKSELKEVDTNDPPIVVHDFAIQRANSEKYNDKNEKLNENLELRNKRVRVIRKSKSETKDDCEIKLIKQDSKENKRDWLKKQLSVNHHYLKDLKMPLNSISHRNAMLNIKRYRLKASSCPNIYKNSMITIDEKEEKWYADCLDCLSDMFNIDLLRKMTFNLLCLGSIILFIWFIVPYFYLAEHMIQHGYNEDDCAVILSLIGITNTIGMVGFGWIGDLPKVSIGNLYATCLVLCGAAVATIPLAVSNYWLLASIAGTFGLLFAGSFTFTPSLLVQLVSLDDFTSAYGLVLLAQGIGHLIGPPLSGLIYDLTSSWAMSFYLAGGWIIFSGVLISFIQPIKNYQEKKLLNKANTEVEA